MAKRFYNNKIVIYWISTGVSPEKIKPFHTNLGPTMTNLTNVIWYEFCLGNVSNDFTKNEQGETFLNGTVYDFLVDHSSVEKEDIHNIHEYLMVKNNIK